MDDLRVQINKLMEVNKPKIDGHIMAQLEAYGENMIDNIIPIQRGFKNLTGNTITSFAYGTYLNKELYNIGIYNGKSAIRWKMVNGEIFTGVDYDGNNRKWFRADVGTDGGYGKETSVAFLENFVPNGDYALVFTTGTEYSAFLENHLQGNVLTDARTFSISNFIQSFKPIES